MYVLWDPPVSDSPVAFGVWRSLEGYAILAITQLWNIRAFPSPPWRKLRLLLHSSFLPPSQLRKPLQARQSSRQRRTVLVPSSWHPSSQNGEKRDFCGLIHPVGLFYYSSPRWLIHSLHKEGVRLFLSHWRVAWRRLPRELMTRPVEPQTRSRGVPSPVPEKALPWTCLSPSQAARKDDEFTGEIGLSLSLVASINVWLFGLYWNYLELGDAAESRCLHCM